MADDLHATRNLLLRALPPAERDRLRPHLRREGLDFGKVLSNPGEAFSTCWFPEGGIVSVTTGDEDGVPTEVSIVGREGFVNTAVILGADQAPLRTVVQVGGAGAFLIGARALRDAARDSAGLREILLRYVQTLFLQVGQTAAANARYPIETRLARWLLMCHDRVEGGEIALTHRFMAVMIAAQRTGVTMALHVLEGTGSIRSRRGRVTILDRARLEELAGESYGRAEAEYRRLIGPFGHGE